MGNELNYFLNMDEVKQIVNMKYQTMFPAISVGYVFRRREKKAKFHIIREKNFTINY